MGLAEKMGGEKKQKLRVSGVVRGDGVGVGTLLAWGSVLGYVVAYLREWGYGNYFGIPMEIVRVGWTEVFVAVAGVVSVLLVMVVMVDLIVVLWPREWRLSGIYGRIVAKGATYLIVTVPVGVLEGWSWAGWGRLGLVVVVLVGLELLWPFLTQSEVKGYRAKLEAEERAEGRTGGRSIVGRVFDRMGRRGWVVAFLMLVTVLAHAVGRGEAVRKKWFWVSKDEEGVVWLRTYGDVMVCRVYNKECRCFRGEVRLKKLSEGSWEIFVERDIGSVKEARRGR